MAVRTVTVRLRADISNYTRGMRQASDTTSRLANAGAATGAAMLAGFAVAAAAAAKFDKALSNVRAVTGASTGEMAKLRAAALEAGKTTSFTATEAANAEAELARAGVSTANIIGGALKGSLALAASGQVSLSEAAVVSAQAMNTFGLAGKDVTHIADLLAAGANKSAADVHGLAMSMRMGGLLAHQTGLSIEDTVGTLAAFADHALIGSDAGTSLKVMLQRLVPQSKEAAGAMEAIGFSAYDSKGEFVGLSEMAGRMKTSFSKLTPEARNSAMATIFGADAVRSATILYELGSEGIDRYVRSVDDTGAAQRMAAIQTDNLVGDLERLKGALEVALIEGGSAANGALRQMTQWITSLVNAYNNLPPSLQHAVTGFMGVGGAITLVGGAMLLLLPRIAATRAALVSMGVTAARARSSLMILGQVGAVVAGLELISYASKRVQETFKDAPPSTAKMAASLVDLGQKGKVAGAAYDTFGKDLDGFGKAVQRVAHPSGQNRATDIVNSLTLDLTEGLAETDIALQDAHDQLKSVDEALGSLVSSGHADVAADAFDQLSANALSQGTSVEKLLTLLPTYSDALASTSVEGKLGADAQGALGDATALTADDMADQRSEAEKLSDALKTLNGVAISAAEHEIGFRQSLADLTEAVTENGTSLDVTTQKGREVKSAFLDAAKAAQEHALAVAEQKGSQEAGQKVLEKDIGLLKRQMDAAGFSADAIAKLTDAYLELPGSATTKVSADTKAALGDLEAVQRKVKGTKGKTVTVDALTDAGQKHLESLGFKIRSTKGKKVTIEVPTGSQQANVDALRRAIAALQDKSVTITTHRREIASKNTSGRPQSGEGGESKYATGGLVRRYASGGSVQASPTGLLSGPGTGTSDDILALFASGAAGRVSNTEFVVNAASTRRYLPLLMAINKGKLPALASGGLAGGGLAGFTYTPTGQAVLGGPSDAKSRYDKEVEDLKKAWEDLTKALADAKKKADAVKDAEKNLAKVRKSKPTKKQLESAKDKVDDARAAKRKADAVVGRERRDVYDADAALGVKKGSRAPTSFNLTAYQKQLNNSLAATTRWRNSLAKIGQRGGAELKALLEGMGEEGYALVNALAGASNKQFADIVKKLQATGELAKATLADFTKQLGGSTKESQQFAKDLQSLAARGFGDLAQALAAQGDSSAQALARQAASGSARDVAAANAAVKANQAALAGDDLVDSLVLLSTLRSKSGAGYADLIAAGLDTATIKALVPRMMAQINSLPAGNRDTFLRQFAAQGGVTAMARGAILGRPTILAAEAGDREAYIPINGSARSRALLATTARMLGYDARPAGRWGTPGGGGGSPYYDQRSTTVTLNGAKQTAAEQAADIARHMQFIG